MIYRYLCIFLWSLPALTLPAIAVCQDQEEVLEEDYDEPTPAEELRTLKGELTEIREELRVAQDEGEEEVVRELQLAEQHLKRLIELFRDLTKHLDELQKAEDVDDEDAIERLEESIEEIHFAVELHHWEHRARELRLEIEFFGRFIKELADDGEQGRLTDARPLFKQLQRMLELVEQMPAAIKQEDDETIEKVEEELEELEGPFELRYELFHLDGELAEAESEGDEDAVRELKGEIREIRSDLREILGEEREDEREKDDSQARVIEQFPDLSKVMLAADFEKQLLPMLQKQCFDCHGDDEQSAGLNLQAIARQRPLVQNLAMWKKVLDQLNLRGMPPEDSDQPSEEERRLLVGGIRYAIEHTDWDKIRDPGTMPARRLTNNEYNHTVRDLLGIKSRPADKFPSDLKGSSGFDNSANTLFLQTLLMEKYIQAAEECVSEAFSGKVEPTEEAVRKHVSRFLMRAYRRPPLEREVSQTLEQFRRGGVKQVARSTLLSPLFLLRVERQQNTAKDYVVDDWDMASRLSYSLWSSMPDDELFELARQGKLHDAKVLDEQVSRMLADPKADTLGTVFASQWLGFEHLGTRVRLDPIDNPWCTDSLMAAMRSESSMFFVSLLREDRSIKEFVAPDYTFMNEELAKHYRIGGVTGDEMRRVQLNHDNRGGVFGQGSLLAVTSFPDRTSPVARGKWILTDVLGTPLPEPPPNASDLAEKIEDRERLTFSQKMELHRSKPQCNSCHQRIDPLGLSLENFDKFGRWRTRVHGRAIDASGILPNGTKFNGLAGLKKVIIAERLDDLTTQLTRKLLAYALGRQLEYYDEPAVREIATAVKQDDYRMQTLLRQVVQSYPFRYKKNRAGEGTTP